MRERYDNGNLSKLPTKTAGKISSGTEKKSKEISLPIEYGSNSNKVKLDLQKKELLNTQTKLLKSINDYSQLFDYAPVSYFILDKKGVIINVNHMGCNQLGIDKKQLKGRHFSSFLNSKICQDEYYKHRNQVIETGKNLKFECKIKRKDGSAFFALIDSAVVKDDQNNFNHFFLVISDITEQKENEHKIALALIKEVELNDMKSQFITIASHEFRTPLATILTSSELIEKYDKYEDIHRRDIHIRKIRSSVHRLIEILMDFMSVNDIENGNIKYNPEIFNLVEFTENIINEVKSFSEIHNVNYKHSGPGNLVFTDKKLLKTCISNLLINAYKYSPDGGTIEIKTDVTDTNNYTIEVKDNGIGIPLKDQSKIFNQFFRAKNSEHIQGIGLGLNITKTFITFLGGEIFFTSIENVGTIFSLKFSKI